MTKTYYFVFLLWNICFSVSVAVDSESCDKDKCYHSVNKEHKNLLDLISRFDSTSSTAEIPKIYDLNQLKNYSNELENVKSEARKIEEILNKSVKQIKQIEKNCTKNQNTINQLSEKLKLITGYDTAALELGETLDEIKHNYDKLESQLKIKENASKACEIAEMWYTRFETFVNNLTQEQENITKSYNHLNSTAKAVNSNVTKTIQQTIKIKNNLEQLKIPSIIIDDYINELEKQLNQSIIYLKENADILEEHFQAARTSINDQIQRESDQVTKSLTEIQNILDSMNDALDKYNNTIIKDSNVTFINNETIDVINLVTNEIQNLENKLKSVEFSDKENLLLDKDYETADFIMKKRLKLIDFIRVLDTIPASASKLEKIEKEIEHLKLTVSLFEELEQLKNQLKHLRRMEAEVFTIDCSQRNILT